MPRGLQSFARSLQAAVAAAVAVAEAGEVALVATRTNSALRGHWHYQRVELLYELAYLRVFVLWELFLEEVLPRLLCGYEGSIGKETLVPGVSYSKSLAAARSAVFGSQQYLLWHNPQVVIKRAQKFFQMGSVETVLASNLARVDAMSAIRHRVAHGSADARAKFDAASMLLSGRRYRGSRAGQFLRDAVPGSLPPRSWLVELSTELVLLGRQIV